MMTQSQSCRGKNRLNFPQHISKGKIGMTHRLARIIALLFVCGTLLAATASHADIVQFGSRSLNIPSPQGFAPISSVSPQALQIMQAYLPNRLAEAYATPDDIQKMFIGQKIMLVRYFQLQVLHRADGVSVTKAGFQEILKQIEDEPGTSINNVTEEVAPLVQHGNAEVEKITAQNPQTTLSDIQYLGIYRRESWGLFSSMKARFTATSSTNKQVIASSAAVLVNHQLLFLYSFSDFHDEHDRQWSEQALSTWADAVRAANPDDAAVAISTQESAQENPQTATIGELIFGSMQSFIVWILIVIFFIVILKWPFRKNKDNQNTDSSQQ
jgi:hypothetical protein